VWLNGKSNTASNRLEQNNPLSSTAKWGARRRSRAKPHTNVEKSFNRWSLPANSKGTQLRHNEPDSCSNDLMQGKDGGAGPREPMVRS
jgi:hypothetical protein